MDTMNGSHIRNNTTDKDGSQFVSDSKKKVINNITSTQKTQQTSLNSVARAVMNNPITFDLLLTNQGEFYAVANSFCYAYIQKDKQYIWGGWKSTCFLD